MNKTDELALNLHQKILQSAEYQTYRRSLEACLKHRELYEAEVQLKKLQQELMKQKADPQADPTCLTAAYLKARAQFEDHPLVVNYLADQAALESLCLYLKTMIEGQLGI